MPHAEYIGQKIEDSLGCGLVVCDEIVELVINE